MKKFFTFILLFATAQLFSQTIDTTNGRYYNEIFPQITTTSNITYGSGIGVNGQPVTLIMDIYQPTGDTVSKRPLIVWAHGGSFIGGSKTNSDVLELATHFAKMGYVCASIDYRIGMFPIDSVNATKAVVRAMQDMKAAVRYFRKDAATSNLYKIHSNYVFAGGSSAGAFMSLHLAYMDKVAEVPVYVNINNMGGIDGISGSPGYSHLVNGVVNLCGALGDSSWIEPGNVPFVSMHGNVDATVPYGSALISVAGFPLMVVDGSASLNPRATNLGINNPFHTYWGSDHVPYFGNIPYMDTTLNFVKVFLRPLLVQPSVTPILSEEIKATVALFPNPTTNTITVAIIDKSTLLQSNLSIVNLLGQEKEIIIVNKSKSNVTLNVSRLPSGIYFLKCGASSEEFVKFVKE